MIEIEFIVNLSMFMYKGIFLKKYNNIIFTKKGINHNEN